MGDLSVKELAERIDGLKEDVKKKVAETKFLYAGVGGNEQFFADRDLFRTACSQLKEEGYATHYLRADDATIKILTAEDISYREVWGSREEIIETALAARRATQDL